MKNIILMFVVLLVSVGGSAFAQGTTYEDSTDQLNYSIGHQVGRDLVRQQAEVRPEVLLQGILDATSGAEPKMSYPAMIDRLAAFKEEIVQSAEGELVRHRRAGEQFLADNANNADVVTLESGLQYRVMKEGSGPVPVSGDLVKVNYTGRKIDGTIFDTTVKDGVATPVEFKVDNVIAGWTEALKMMPTGSTWVLFIPHNLAFRDTGPLAGQTVVFEVELIDIVPGKS
jgi:FKBP-type peptidyl-prolyl cis-trans isomerase FklB